MLYFNSKQKGALKAIDASMFQQVADLTAIALSNIIAKEEIVKREEEKTNLLAISEAISKAKNATELLATIREKVTALIPFEDTGILIVEKDGLHHYDMAVNFKGWDESHANKLLQQHSHLTLIEHVGSYLEAVIKKLEKKETPIIEDWEVAIEEWDHPFFPIIKHLEYKEALVALLKYGDEILGSFWLNSKKSGDFGKGQFALFQAIAEQVSVAVANILAKEEILEREKEKDILLNISKKLSKVKKADDVLQIIIQEVKPIFNFFDTGILLIDKSGNGYYDLSVLSPHLDGSSINYQLNEKGYYQSNSIPLNNSVTAWVIEQLKGKAAYIFDYLADYSTFYDALLLQEIKNAGYAKAWISPLIQQGEVFGIFSLNYTNNNGIPIEKEQLFIAVCDRIATSLNNILINEEILEREKEKTNLLSISEAISKAKNTTELLATIREKVMQLIPFHDTGILIIEKDGLNHYDMAVNIKDWDPTEGNEKLHEMGVFQIPHKGSYVDVVMQLIAEKQSPIIEDYQLRVKEFDYPFFGILEEMGYEEGMVTTLRSGGKAFGTLWLNSLKRNHFSSNQFALFQSIADQVSVAVANILAKEEIVEREKEKTLLLSLSEYMANIRNREDLLLLMLEKIKPVVQFDDAVISKYSSNFLQYEHIITASPPERKLHPQYNQIVGQPLNMTGTPDEYILNNIKQKDVFQFNTTDIQQMFPTHFIGDFLKEIGLMYNLYLKLSWAGNIIGFMNFHFSSEATINPNKFSLYKSISEQISATLANILANEEIVKREKEKSILLSISQQISQIRDLDTLVNWLHIEANKMHQSQHVMIVLTNPKENTVQLILGDADAKWQKATGMRPKKGLINLPTPYKGSIFEHIESLPEGQLYSAADFNFPETYNFCSVDFQLAESFYVKLIHKGEPIGHISFHTFTKGIFKNIDIGLCKNFANQLAVSLKNILSNEAIAEREKQKTFEIKINNAVLKNDRFEDVLKEVTESINKAVGCDICYIRIRSEDIDVKPFNLFCEKKGSDYLIKSRDSILKEMAVKHAEIEKDINDFFATLEHPLILTGTALEEKQYQFNYLKAFKNTFNIQSFAFMPLYTKGKAKVQLVIGSKRAFAYIDNDLETIHQIIPQLSLTLDNRLAFVQIQKLKEMLETENLYLHEEINDNYNFNEIVGNSEALQTVFSQASMVADTDTTVLIGGETGTGKELIARAIHNLSSRKDKIMVKVNCACLPAQLIESELFGHERGAFTGAIEKRIGKFELANGGTIFLDEIGELPLELQSKLLRVIQEREFERIGGRTILKTDIRIIAATNKNLETESNEKRFRSDLYYRLNVFPIVIPALKERKEDIPLLALHFAKKFGQRMRKNITAITNEALQEMMLYDWPGNIRELEHVIEHSVISSKSSKLALGRPLLTNKTTVTKSLNDFKLKTLDDNERDHIMAILKYCNGRVRGNGGAAQILNIHPNTLESRMQKLGIKRQHLIKG